MSGATQPGTFDDEQQDALCSVLTEYPVRLAILFGSAASEEVDAGSDIDVAIEFEPEVARAERHDLFVRLLTELMAVVERDEVDLSEIGDLDPAVGREALSDATVLVGPSRRAEYHRAAFERLAAEQPSMRERADRVLTRLSR